MTFCVICRNTTISGLLVWPAVPTTPAVSHTADRHVKHSWRTGRLPGQSARRTRHPDFNASSRIMFHAFDHEKLRLMALARAEPNSLPDRSGRTSRCAPITKVKKVNRPTIIVGLCRLQRIGVQTSFTFSAFGPLGPRPSSNDTRCPSWSSLNCTSTRAELWKKGPCRPPCR